jgi:(4-(4-[2-(gamma-L-glutamylamino)ethyl]phenoxymethyl)furan-2-yl)methanamine synthase
MHLSDTATIGWDIGGVHTKVVRRAPSGTLTPRSRVFAIEHEVASLQALLEEMKLAVGADEGDRHGVTMTAELSQAFRTKREGVEKILDVVARTLGERTGIFATDGQFLSIAEARRNPLAVAASNWVATGMMVARACPEAILIDTGSTTTDLIPIVAGRVAAQGMTDPERLASGELVYTGVVRTPVEAIASSLPWRGGSVGVSAEGFALSADVYLWLGQIATSDYTAPTPDRRPATRPFAGERLARVICADREMLEENEITGLARSIAEAQVDRLAATLRSVLNRHPTIRQAVVTGIGDFLGLAAARRIGLEVHSLADDLGPDASRVAPAAAIALLLSESNEVRHATRRISRESAPGHQGLTVVKIGGGILAIPGAFERVTRAVATASKKARLVVFPGGGPFADIVRDIDGKMGLSPSSAHWMAILAMDQYAHVLAEQIADAEIVDGSAGIAKVHERGGIPVLAPHRWLKSADELPHTWSVTSDSLAAYIAALLGAHRLVVIKPREGGMELMDPHFTRALPDGIELRVLGPKQLEQLEENLAG